MIKTPLTDSEAVRSNCGTIVSADFARDLEERMHKAERIVQLIDAIDDLECSHGNPIGSDQIEAYVLKKQEEKAKKSAP